MGVSVQQNCSGHRRHSSRCDDLRDAGSLLRRVQAGLLDVGTNATASHSIWPFRTARLSELASFYACGLAYVRTGAHWIAVSRSAFSCHYLRYHANDREPRASVQTNLMSNVWAIVAAEAFGRGYVANQNALIKVVRF